MPERTFNSNDYRFGFNGKEKDDEIKGTGNHYDYGMRAYDPRIGRFMSVDPLTKKYPFYTPYSFAGNKPIWAIDLDGEEELIYQYIVLDISKGNVTLKGINKNVIFEAVQGNYPHTQATNKNTGKPFNNSEWGTLQQQYFDIEGNQLDIKRGINGDFIKGTGEILKYNRENTFLPEGVLSNMGDFLGLGYNGSIYIGPNNPEVSSNGRNVADYRREPTDLMDAAAMQHDMDYDQQKVAGLEGVLSTKTIAADIKLVENAKNVLKLSETDVIDPYTNKNISDQTKERAHTIIKAFTKIIEYKSQKLNNKSK